MSEALDDDDIIKTLQSTHEDKNINPSDASKDECEEAPVSRKETSQALSILWRSLEQSGASDEEYNAQYSIQNTILQVYTSNSHQTKIDSFFPSTL